MARQLKEQEMRVLRFIYDHIKSNDCAPTRKEIAEALDIPMSPACYRVGNLFAYGYLRETEPKQWARNIALTEQCFLTCKKIKGKN